MTVPDLSAWGTATDIAPVPGGARRLAFRARVGGRLVIAKSNALPEPSLRWQIAAERAARRAGLIVPGLIETASGALSSAGWTLEPWIDGHPAKAGDLRQLPLARLRAAGRHLPRRPGRTRVLPASWARLSALPGPNGLIHGDLHPGNLLRLHNGLALIDWEEARIGPLAVDDAAIARARGIACPDHARAELVACAMAEPNRARAMARHLMTRRWS